MNYKFKSNTITIGCDPEFILVNKKNGRLEAAGDHMFFDHIGRDCKIGRDGCPIPVEIRPEPAKINNIKPFIRDIDLIIKDISSYCTPKNLTIFGGASPFNKSIGGHIHFGGKQILVENVPQNIYNRRIKRIKKIVKTLDTHMMPLLYGIFDPKEISRRLNGNYGRLSDWRIQPYGFEYRTPYSFLVSPTMTTGIYNLATLIYTHNNTLYPPIDMTRDTNSLFRLLRDREIDKSSELAKTLIKRIKKRILKVMGYYSPNPEYNGATVSLFGLDKQDKKISTNVLYNYGLQNEDYRYKEMFIIRWTTNRLDYICKTLKELLQYNSRLVGHKIEMFLAHNCSNEDGEYEILCHDDDYLQSDYESYMFIPEELYCPPDFEAKNISMILYRTYHSTPHIGLSKHLISRMNEDPTLIKWFAEYITNIFVDY